MPNNKDINNSYEYYKGKNISNQLLSNLTSSEEVDNTLVKEYFTQNIHCSEFKKIITDPIKLERKIDDFSNVGKFMKKEVLLEELSNTDRKRKIRLAYKWVATSGIVAAVLFLSFLIYKNDDIVTTPYITEEVIVTPTLITSSGEIINLEENTNDKVINNEYAIKVDNNVLQTYQITANTEDVISLNTLIVPLGGTYSVALDDGSVVKLNAGSKINYPVKFSKDKREVELTGEAFFDVKEGDKPFIVKTKGVEVVVYGTLFNVKELMNGDVETVLLEGSVGLRSEFCEEFKIAPNQLGVISKDGDYKVENVDVYNYVGWVNNSFRYYQTDLRIALRDIELWYNIRLSNINDIDDGTTINMDIDRTSSIEKIFRIIEATTKYMIINEGGGNYRIEKSIEK